MIPPSLPSGPGPDINRDSADEMQPHGSLIRKSVISLSQRPGSPRESPSHLPSSPSHPKNEIRLEGIWPLGTRSRRGSMNTGENEMPGHAFLCQAASADWPSIMRRRKWWCLSSWKFPPLKKPLGRFGWPSWICSSLVCLRPESHGPRGLVWSKNIDSVAKMRFHMMCDASQQLFFKSPCYPPLSLLQNCVHAPTPRFSASWKGLFQSVVSRLASWLHTTGWFQMMGCQLFSTPPTQRSSLFLLLTLWTGLWLLQPMECGSSDPTWFLRLSLCFVCWNTHAWSLEPPSKKSNCPKATRHEKPHREAIGKQAFQSVVPT